MLLYSRMDRLNSLFKQEVSNILLFELKDPRIGFVTITRVCLTKDLSYARIFVSVYGSQEEQDKTLTGLNSAKGFIKKRVGKTIRMKRVPEIVFELDDSLKEGFRMSQIIDKLDGHETV